MHYNINYLFLVMSQKIIYNFLLTYFWQYDPHL